MNSEWESEKAYFKFFMEKHEIELPEADKLIQAADNEIEQSKQELIWANENYTKCLEEKQELQDVIDMLGAQSAGPEAETEQQTEEVLRQEIERLRETLRKIAAPTMPVNALVLMKIAQEALK